MVPKAISSRPGLPLEGWAIGLSLLAVLFVAWAWLFRMGAASEIYICRVQATALPSAIGMWVAMMVAMMVPSGAAHDLDLCASDGPVRAEFFRLGLIAVFAAIYLIVWSGFGAVAAPNGVDVGGRARSSAMGSSPTLAMRARFSSSRASTNGPR